MSRAQNKEATRRSKVVAKSKTGKVGKGKKLPSVMDTPLPPANGNRAQRRARDAILKKQKSYLERRQS